MKEVIAIKLSSLHARRNYSQTFQNDRFLMHTHGDHEIYCFLEGKARYTVEGNIYPLEKGDILLMRKGEAHFLMPESDGPYERIIVNFDFANSDDEYITKKLLSIFNDRPLGKFNRYPAELFKDTNWLYYLEKMCDSSDDNQKLIYLTVLLEELYENFETVKNDIHDSESNSSKNVIKYINRHLTEELSLDRICERFYISKSQLNRNFKKTNGSTVWEYITAKRLLLAKEYLQKGEKPTSVYQKCGFQDYVTFYKAYKKYFSSSPKSDCIANS